MTESDDIKRLRSQFASAGYDVKKMSAESQPILSGTAGELIDRLIASARKASIREQPRGESILAASRLALEEYVAGIQESEALRLREIAAASRSLYDQNQEIQRLRSSALTEGELDDLDSCIGDSLFGFERRSDDLDDTEIEFVERCTALREKLSRLRSTYSRESVKQEGQDHEG